MITWFVQFRRVMSKWKLFGFSSRKRDLGRICSSVRGGKGPDTEGATEVMVRSDEPKDEGWGSFFDC